MKILMVNTGVFPVPTSRGGAENHVYYLSRSLSKLGIEIDLVSDIGTNAEFDDNIHTHPINLPEYSVFEKGFLGYMLRHSLGGFYAFKTTRELLKQNNYDLIHVHGRVAPFLTSRFSKNIPIVFTLNDDPPVKEQSNYLTYKVSYRLLQETAAKRATHIIAVHNQQKKELINKGINREKISVIPNGVDIDLFKKTKKDTIDNKILFVGSLTKRKGVKYLLEAHSKINNVELWIVGDGPERSQLEGIASNLGVDERVIFVSTVSPTKLPDYYSSASIFVLPSLREAFPLSILEAMSCSLPVVASNTSGIPEVIEDEYNGFLTEPANVEQLRSKIEFLFETPELIRKMGKNARKTIEKSYSWDVIANQTVKVYRNVLEDKS